MLDGKQGYYVTKMVKVVKIQDENYRQLLKILHGLEKERNQRVSFDEVISLLVKEHQERQGKELNEGTK